MKNIKNMYSEYKIWIFVGCGAICSIFFILFQLFGHTAAPPILTAVTYKNVQIESIRPWSQFSGKCRAVDYVDISPRVSGMIQEVLFKEGALVKKDDPLFIIDPRPFEAEVKRAKANLDSAISQEKLAAIELERASKLVKTNALTKKEFDERTSAREVRRADIGVAEASLKIAELNLEFAHIKSPIHGKIGRAAITPGNLVQSGATAPILTTIMSTSSIYVDFDMDEQSYIEAAKNLDTSISNADTIPVEVTVDGNKETIYAGHIVSFDNKINPSTGTIKVRARVDNPKDILVSGIFVNVNVKTRQDQKAMLVPDGAVGTDQNKKFVYLIDPKNEVIYREIKIGRSFEENYIVKEGLQEGDKVIVNGLQHIRPGMPVEPILMKASTLKSKEAPLENQKKDEKKAGHSS